MTVPDASDDADREFRDPDRLIRRAKRGTPEFDQHCLVNDLLRKRAERRVT